MALKYVSSASKLYDFFRVLIMQFNDLSSSKLMRETVLDDSAFILDIMDTISKDFDKTVPGLALFFTHSDGNPSYVITKYDNQLLALDNIENFIESFFAEDPKEVLIDLMKHFADENKTTATIQDILDDSNKLFRFVSKLNISDKQKLELIEFSIVPASLLAPLEVFLKKMRRRIRRSYSDSSVEYNKAVKAFTVKIHNSPDRLLSLTAHCLDLELSPDDDYFIAISLLQEFMVHLIENDDGTKLIILGCNSERVLQRGTHRDNVIITETFFKAFADRTRLRIITYLARDDMYVGEIAKKCRLAISTASYHLDILLTAEIISGELINKRVYYTLNKDYVTKQFLFYNGLLYKGRR